MSLSPKAQGIFDAAGKRSEDGIARMRAAAAELIGGDDRFIVGVNGSYARREVTGGSDVDLFVLYRNDAIKEAQEVQAELREKLECDNFKMPAPGGVFQALSRSAY